MPGVMTTGEFRQYMMPKIQKEVTTNMAKLLKRGEFKMFVDEGSVTTEKTEYHSPENSGGAQFIEEGVAPPLESINDGWKKTLTVVEAGLMGAYTKRMVQLGRKDLQAKVTKMMQEAQPKQYEDLCALYIEYADTATASVPHLNGKPVIDTICNDGQTIASTSHGWLSDQLHTYSNKAASLTTLSADTAYNDVNVVEGWTDNTGRLMNFRVQRLIVGLPNRQQAYRLFASDDDAETTNRSTNTLRQIFSKSDFEVYRNMLSPQERMYQTDAPKTFRFDSAWAPNIETEYDKKTRINYLILDYAFAHGPVDPRNLYYVKA